MLKLQVTYSCLSMNTIILSELMINYKLNFTPPINDLFICGTLSTVVELLGKLWHHTLVVSLTHDAMVEIRGCVGICVSQWMSILRES